MDRSTKRFSKNNTPFYHIHPWKRIEDIPYIPDDIPKFAPMLKRQSNEWMSYFGKFPESCAYIGVVDSFVGKNGTQIGRHVCGVPVNSDMLTLYPSNEDIFNAQKDISEKIEMVTTQLQVFAEADLLSFKTTAGKITITMGETIHLTFIVCDDTGMFHVTISKDTAFVCSLVYPEMHNLNKLIYVLRSLFNHNTSPLVSNFDFEIDEDIWHSLQYLTIEPTKEYLPKKLTLIHPDLIESSEFDPETTGCGLEWSKDDFADFDL